MNVRVNRAPPNSGDRFGTGFVDRAYTAHAMPWQAPGAIYGHHFVHVLNVGMKIKVRRLQAGLSLSGVESFE